MSKVLIFLSFKRKLYQEITLTFQFDWLIYAFWNLKTFNLVGGWVGGWLGGWVVLFYPLLFFSGMLTSMVC